MKFIFADSIDVVDPGYDFVADRNAAGRRPYWDDVYPHEILGYAPYDGMLVSRGIVGDDRVKGKYSESQALRFRREGVRKFLRLDREGVKSLDIFGDCGAFTYVNEDVPPYSSVRWRPSTMTAVSRMAARSTTSSLTSTTRRAGSLKVPRRQSAGPRLPDQMPRSSCRKRGISQTASRPWVWSRDGQPPVWHQPQSA